MLRAIKKMIPQGMKQSIKNLLLDDSSNATTKDKREWLVGMTTIHEQRWYTHIAKELAHMDGAIVDLGSWMGSTAISLAKGVRDAGTTGNGREKMVYAIDRYLWEPWMDSYGKHLHCDYVPGDSFLPEVRQRLRLSGLSVTAVQADLTKYTWDGGDIAILLVDAMKSKQLCTAIALEFYPKLLVGGVVIHQDFKHFYCPWIHMLQYRLKDFFVHVHDVPSSGTTSFKLVKAIPGPVLQDVFAQEVQDEHMSDAIQHSMALVAKEERPNIAAAHVMHFVHSGRLKEALALWDGYVATYGEAGDLKKVHELMLKKQGKA